MSPNDELTEELSAITFVASASTVTKALEAQHLGGMATDASAMGRSRLLDPIPAQIVVE